MADPFAGPDDLVKAWRTLGADEVPRAEYYLGVASRKVRRRWSDVDDRIASGALDAEDVRDVVVHMVLGVVDGAPVRGARSWSETRGPIQQSVTLQSGRAELLAFEGWMVEVFEGRTVHVGPRGSFPPAENFDGAFGRRRRSAR